MSSGDQDVTRREMISKGLRKKKDCENKASAIVETFIENITDRETIRNALNHITQSHYDDIVNERSIDGKCGYIVCQEQLKNIPSQKYRINTKTNEVLDLSERKKFCGEVCFRHSIYLHDQILTSPLWLREEKDHKKYLFKDEETKLISKPLNDDSVDIPKRKDKPKAKKKKVQIWRPKLSKSEDSSEIVFNIYKQWWTRESVAFLKGSTEVSIEEEEEERDVSKAKSESASKIQDSPCMKMHAKLQAFYNGTTDIDLSGSIKEIDLEDKEPVLPQIDKTAQKSLRRSIVLEGFQKAFDSFSDLVELKWSVVSNQAKGLVQTFNLTADNVVLRPNAWLLATGILIQCLAIQNVSLQSSLEQPFFKQLFSKVNYDGKHVSIFVDELMNLV